MMYLRSMELLRIFEENYEKFRVLGFDSKYLPYLKLRSYLDQKNYPKNLIGKSFLGNEIYSLSIGKGPIKVLAWSQMHGNEATGTRAMLDVWEFLLSDLEWSKKMLDKISFHFVPMLNPDGSTQFSRRNVCGIDLNRDFLQEASPEIRVLKNFVAEIQPQFLFNLHDQRSIFNVGTTKEPATLAFLAPSFEESRSLNDQRIASMAVIDHMAKGLHQVIPNKIARFSDEFYPTSTGDNFMKMGYSTILFEAGHFPKDYSRDQVRKFNALAILLALDRIVDKNPYEIGDYLNIPGNNKKYLDVILRNVKVQSNEFESVLDIGIYFEEKLNTKTQEIEFLGRIEEIGDLSAYFGHIDIDKKGKNYIGKSSIFPIIGEFADFSVGAYHFEKGKLLN